MNLLIFENGYEYFHFFYVFKKNLENFEKWTNVANFGFFFNKILTFLLFYRILSVYDVSYRIEFI